MKILHKYFIVTSTFLIYSYHFCLAQLDYEFFKERYLIHPSDSNSVKFGFSNLNFMKNNEYFSDIVDGYTLYGYQLHPRIAYFPNANMRFDAGVYLLQEYGFDGFTKAVPTFTFKVKKHGIELIFGNLEGSLNHGLIEPLFDFESVFVKKLEYGSQIIINTKKFWFDGWMNWERGIHKGAAFQEELTLGTSSLTTLYQKDNSFQLKLPIQGMIIHKGGQIDITDDPVFTQFYFASGPSFYFDFNKDDFITAMYLENYFVYYKDWSFTKYQAFQEGMGMYIAFMLKTKLGLNFLTQYWSGSQLIAFRGTPLYQSVSSKTANYTESNRHLLIVKLIHEHEFFKDLFMSTRFEPYYDINNQLLEYGYSIHATYHTDILLKKIK